MKSICSKITITKPKKECFICYNNNKQALLLLSNLVDKTNCKCDGYIHKRCLKKWTSLKKTCPICNSNIYKTPSSIISNTIETNYHVTGTMIIRIYNPRIVKYFTYAYEIFIILLISSYILYLIEVIFYSKNYY